MSKPGVVYAPARGRLFYTGESGRTVEEFGAHYPDTVGETKAIGVSTPDPPTLLIVASKSRRDAITDDFISRYNVADMRSAGSSLKFCLVATGPRLGRTMEWDTAAGQVVLTGAGDRVVCANDLSVLTYGKLGFENPHFIAYAPGIEIVAQK